MLQCIGPCYAVRPWKFRDVQGPGIVDVNSHRGDLEQIVLKTHQVLVRPDPQAAVFRQTVSAYTGAGEDHVRVCRPDLDRVDHLH